MKVVSNNLKLKWVSLISLFETSFIFVLFDTNFASMPFALGIWYVIVVKRFYTFVLYLVFNAIMESLRGVPK